MVLGAKMARSWSVTHYLTEIVVGKPTLGAKYQPQSGGQCQADPDLTCKMTIRYNSANFMTKNDDPGGPVAPFSLSCVWISSPSTLVNGRHRGRLGEWFWELKWRDPYPYPTM